MADPRDMVEIGGQPVAAASAPARQPTGQPFLRLWFRCSNQYTRAYKSADGTQYLGRCPKCGLPARFAVGEGGTTERFFEMSCNR